ncbi:fumarylacetoacetate hydrolase family protein [Sphingomonas sp.]|jgi:2-keto-4-pentenoate hydratase/2-oxohepta-3-ene-1,7-dioic acid hydratase in catechol pathway|uniref:fumarylacetoacetate hydrolase family protein n=1 Tax=Sphingomonas sp. TaxID=28214 RepID=UPI002ED8B7E2
MKLLSFDGGAGPCLGALGGDGAIVDISQASPALSSMQALIEGGDAALDIARSIVQRAQGGRDPSSVRWLAPLPVPVQMRDFLVFEEHMRMAGWQGAKLRATWGAPPAPPEPMAIPPIWYSQPIYYKCNRFAVSGPGDTVHWPDYSRIIDYELELACVIGKRGRDIPASRAAGHIFGYTIWNDFTARDAQFQEMQGPLGPAKGKDFDGANMLGPVIVTADAIDPANLAMRALVNGALWSEGNSGSMHWSFAQIIEHVSRSETLHPGEVLGSGTVGSGCGLELGRFLKHGDRIELQIEGIGTLAALIDAPLVTEQVTL